MKSFEVKIYNRLGVFKETINPKRISSEISFSEDLDGGQGDLTLTFKGTLDDYLETDIVEIREVDRENKTISRTYTGVVEEIGIDEFPKETIISLSLLGVFTALNDIKFKQSGNRKFTITATPGSMVKTIIDSFNTDYGSLTGQTQNISGNIVKYTASSIDITGTNASIEFDDMSCLDAIKKALEDKGLSFFIGADGVCYVKQDAGQSKVSLTMGRQVTKMNRKVHKREMCNKLYHERVGNVVSIFTDPVSIALYGVKEHSEVDTEIQDVTTQNTVGTKYVQEHAFGRFEIEIYMKPQQSESIFPGMMISINNISVPLVDKKITKIGKSKDQWTLYVGDFISFGKEILKK